MRLLTVYLAMALAAPAVASAQSNPTGLCLDGFCIGQSIAAKRFDEVAWLMPKDARQIACSAIACQPHIAFRGYAAADQAALAQSLSWVYSVSFKDFAIVTAQTLAPFRRYRHECNPSPRMFGERRFLGLYRSEPSGHITVVGLRGSGDGLKVYRIAREIPVQSGEQLQALGRSVRAQYGDDVLLYDYLSSNAYSEVKEQRKLGWLARSTTFNAADPADNRAELVLIDPATRHLLLPSSMPDSGEIEDLPARRERICEAPVSLQ